MKLGMGSVGAGGLIWLVATACGETNDGSDSEQSANGSGGSTSSTGSTGTETGAETTTAFGAMGSSTMGPGATGTGTTGTSTTATNGPGSTSMGSGGTNSSSCPSVEPAIGTSCADEGLSCTFTSCTAPNYRNDHTLSCVQGAWTLASEVECLASCPGTAPDIGSPCETEETPGPCPVENACGMTEVYCVEGEWSLYPPGSDGSDRAPRPPDGAGGSSDIIVQPLCPEGAPTLYTACCPLTTPDYCDYRPGGSSDLLPPNTVGSTTGAQGSGGASGSASTTGGTGGTGGTGAFGLCLTCDRTQLVWVASNACP